MIHLNDQSTDILRDSDLAITLADPSSPDCALILANERFAEITGYTEHSALGHNCRFLQCAETSRDDARKISTAIARRAPIARCLRNQRKSGEKFWNLLTISTVWYGEKPLVIGCQHDLGVSPSHRDVKAYNEQLFTLIERVSIRRPLSWGLISNSIQMQAMSVFMMARPTIVRSAETSAEDET